MTKLDNCFNKLLKLKDGWYDAESKAIPKKSLLEYFNFLERTIRDLPTPSVFPTRDEGVQAEWWTNEVSVEVELNTRENMVWFSFINHKTEEEFWEEYPFYCEESVNRTVELLKTYLSASSDTYEHDQNTVSRKKA